MTMTVLRRLAAGLALGTAVLAGPVTAQTISNGSFDTFNGCTGCSWGGTTTTTQQLNNTDTPNWTTTAGYAFILTPNQAITGFKGPDDPALISLWSPTAGAVTGNGGLGSVAITPSPADVAAGQSQTTSRFLAIDPSYPRTGDYVQTTVTGLVTGGFYLVSYYTAAAQQKGFTLSGSGQTQQVDNWTIKVLNGSTVTQTVTSGNVIDQDQAFSGWVQQSFTMIAAATSMTLQFIANSNVSVGQPPFMLLDGVTVKVPEPSGIALLGTGLVALVGYARRRRKGT